jgi:RNA polymerase sigma-70 factor (ECF subfamily)
MNGQEADIRDEALLALIAAGGDPGDAAVTALYRRYRIVLLRFFLSQGASRDDSSDILQETIIKIVRGAASYSGNGTAKSWIWQVARNCLTDYLRKSLTIGERETLFDDPDRHLADIEDESPPADSSYHVDAIKKCVAQGVNAFKRIAPDRHFVLALYAQQFSVEEIGERIGRTASATKVYLFQCREKLRPFLDQCRGLLQ